ncbi:MAG: tRNA (guanosine(46)-N7)-methyltransferase TrmB [Lachnospiraceae bacterium]|nr:tRNA (guanosine(46)-N7)-methyltransferase TrmB [Lachnospiraceae bacterium]
MRLRNITGCREMIAESEFVVPEEELTSSPGTWRERFGNDHPIRIEIGMGKGRFLYQLAGDNPGVNYIGIEKFSAVLLRAVQKMETDPRENLIFVRMDAEIIDRVFAPGEVDRIYLNFSDPWPKDRHAKRRLPSRQFLARFGKILKEDGVIEFKTDNRPLFDFAVEEAQEAGWEILGLTYDLHNAPDAEDLRQGNVMTEYEERFSAQGNPICKYVIRKKQEA